MERDFYTLRSIKMSLTIITFICTIIFICVLNKRRFLFTPNRPGNEFVHASSASSHSPAQEIDSESPVWTEGISANHLSKDSERKQSNEGDHPNEELSERVGPADPESLTGQQTYNNITKTSAYKVCSYARGKWVIDDSRPLYSGLGCKQWLSKMWACRLTQRADFAYEKLRWLPKHCKMEEFSASKFLDTRMYNKTLAFIGDSLGRQQFQSLMCMLTGGAGRPDVRDMGREYGLVKAPHALRPDGWAYLFPGTNTTILFYWSASLCNLEPLDPATTVTSHAMHLDRPPTFLKRFIHRFDVVVLNTGHHWNRGKIDGNRWVMHVGGSPRIVDIISAKNLTIHSIIRWADLEIRKRPNLKVFYRTISPRHYVHGDWNTGGSCNNTVPMAAGKEVSQDESMDPIPFNAVRATRVNVLDITAISQVRDEGHISRYTTKATSDLQDCLHWCLPGIPDTWNELLLAQL